MEINEIIKNLQKLNAFTKKGYVRAFWNKDEDKVKAFNYGIKDLKPHPFLINTVEKNKRKWCELYSSELVRTLNPTVALNRVAQEIKKDLQNELKKYNIEKVIINKGDEEKETEIVFDVNEMANNILTEVGFK